MITMKKIAITLFFCASCFVLLFAQKEPAWDNSSKRKWDSAFQKVEIPSSKDGRERLNALKNIDSYLDKAQVEKKRYDYIIVCLGTNDSKKMFDSRQGEVSENLKALLAKIKKHKLCKGAKPNLFM